MMGHEPVPRTPLAIIQQHYAASDRGDVDGMVTDLASDVSWTEMAGFPYAGTYIGPAAVIENVFARIGADWVDYTARTGHLVASGDEVVAFGVYSGTYRTTGKSMTARYVHHWTLADGVVIGFEQFTDTALVRDAMD